MGTRHSGPRAPRGPRSVGEPPALHGRPERRIPERSTVIRSSRSSPAGRSSPCDFEGSVPVREIDVELRGLERRPQALVQEVGQLLAAAHRPRPGGELLEHVPRVIGRPEKRAIDALRDAAVQPRAREGEAQPERDADGHGEGRGPRSSSQPDLEEKPDQERAGGEARERDERQEAALHEQVARAAPEQDGDLEHAVLHHRISEGEGPQEQGYDREGPRPERQAGGRTTQDEGGDVDEEDGEQPGRRPPKHHACLATSLGPLAEARVADEGREAEDERSDAVQDC